MFVGTSLILRQRSRLLYGLRPPRLEGSRTVMELTGIGGGVEDEDDTPAAGALREAQEEIGCPVRLLACPKTVVVRGPDQVERVALQGEARPAAVVFRRYRTPPHQPWHAENQGEACLVVFLANLEGQPRPAMELPALLWLRPDHLPEVARRDVRLQTLVAFGAELVTGEAELPLAAAWTRLTDSQEALVLALREGAVPFYEALLATARKMEL